MSLGLLPAASIRVGLTIFVGISFPLQFAYPSRTVRHLPELP
jgi:hypothetical protein